MTDDNRTPDRGQIGLYALVGLAVLATIIMLFTDSGAWLKIALIAALWAAAVGFFLVYRSRKEKAEVELQLEASNQAHKAEMRAQKAEADKERTALEKAQADGGLTTVDAELLKEIREELAVVRAKLEELSGREFGYEPAALRAEARRIMELQASTAQATSAKSHPETAETPIVVPEPDDGLESPLPKPEPHMSKAPSPEAVAGHIGGYEEPVNRESNPLSQLISERKEAEKQAEKAAQKPAAKKTEKKPADKKAEKQAEKKSDKKAAEKQAEMKAEKKPAAPAAEAKKPEAKKPEEPSYRGRRRAEDKEAASAEEQGGRRRRRSDENEGGVSVAELMARMKSKEK